MGYRISYENGGSREQVPDKLFRNPGRGKLFILILVLTIVCCALWRNENIRRSLLPGDPVVTEAAIDNFVESIQGGDGIGNAVTAFCREVIEGAGK